MHLFKQLRNKIYKLKKMAVGLYSLLVQVCLAIFLYCINGHSFRLCLNLSFKSFVPHILQSGREEINHVKKPGVESNPSFC